MLISDDNTKTKSKNSLSQFTVKTYKDRENNENPSKGSFFSECCFNSRNDNEEENEDNDDPSYEVEKSELLGRKKNKTDTFKDRNLIKKVKIKCLNLYERLVQDCLTNPKIFSLSSTRNKKRRNTLRLFKADISKCRNYLLLRTQMRVIISTFTDINLELLQVKEDKKTRLEFLLNITWGDLLQYLKRGTRSILCEGTEKWDKPNTNDLGLYFKYINNINYSYETRLPMNGTYMQHYQAIQKKSKDLPQQMDTAKWICEIKNYFINFANDTAL